MMPTYGWLEKSAAVSALQGRLNNTAFWSADECWVYLSEALRHFSAMTECWSQDLTITDANGVWINTGMLDGSPRLRSVTDIDLYTQMEYMLLEPPSGGTWTGTKQFDIAALQYSLQKRTQEVIQASSCNLGQLSLIPTTPGTRRSALSDNVLDPRRIRFLALLSTTIGNAAIGAQSITLADASSIFTGQIVSGEGVQDWTFVTGIAGNVVKISLPLSGPLSSTALQFSQPVTLTREDTQAFQYFEPDYLQDQGLPQSWAISAEPPLSFDVDIAPNTPGAYDVIALSAAPTFAPPSASLLGVPDDWSWLPMYGALADVLGRESESTDRQRAAYCLQRYTQGLELMQKSNWMKQATVDGVGVDTPAIAEMDDYAPGWQASNGNLPALVQAGIDFIAPTPGLGQGISITLVGNAPLLDTTGVYVQCARDDFEAILNYAQVAAVFKCGGSEFSQTLPLLKDFYRAVGERNKRWLTMGIFTDVLSTEGQRQEEVEPR